MRSIVLAASMPPQYFRNAAMNDKFGTRGPDSLQLRPGMSDVRSNARRHTTRRKIMDHPSGRSLGLVTQRQKLPQQRFTLSPPGRTLWALVQASKILLRRIAGHRGAPMDCLRWTTAAFNSWVWRQGPKNSYNSSALSTATLWRVTVFRLGKDPKRSGRQNSRSMR